MKGNISQREHRIGFTVNIPIKIVHELLTLMRDKKQSIANHRSYHQRCYNILNQTYFFFIWITQMTKHI